MMNDKSMMSGAQDMGGMDDMEGQATGGGYTIEIEVSADGQIQVCVEPGTHDDKDEGMSKYVPAASIDEALSTARDIFRNDGKMPEGGDDGMKAAQAGYDRKAGKRMMGGDSPMGAVFGE